MMIEGRENIAAVFSLFHDGAISAYMQGKDGLMLLVEIPFLTQRINPGFSKFLVCLFEVKNIQFETWPGAADNASQTLTSLDKIFQPRLDILQAEATDNTIDVACHLASPGFPYGGGELQIDASVATVSDEAGKFWTLDELDRLCKDYWDEHARNS